MDPPDQPASSPQLKTLNNHICKVPLAIARHIFTDFRAEEDVDISGGCNSAYCSRDRLVATSAMALLGIWGDKKAGCGPSLVW